MSDDSTEKAPETGATAEETAKEAAKKAKKKKELGGPDGPEPTRYGDWERKGIAVDF